MCVFVWLCVCLFELCVNVCCVCLSLWCVLCVCVCLLFKLCLFPSFLFLLKTNAFRCNIRCEQREEQFWQKEDPNSVTRVINITLVALLMMPLGILFNCRLL